MTMITLGMLMNINALPPMAMDEAMAPMAPSMPSSVAISTLLFLTVLTDGPPLVGERPKRLRFRAGRGGEGGLSPGTRRTMGRIDREGGTAAPPLPQLHPPRADGPPLPRMPE
ncbi:hypothetical protein JCM17961_43370 [Endothiovibrio diazotrophicus]